MVLVEAAVTAQVGEELAAIDVVQDQMQPAVRLEGIVQVHQEGRLKQARA